MYRKQERLNKTYVKRAVTSFSKSYPCWSPRGLKLFVVKLAVGSHCCHYYLLAVVNFTVSLLAINISCQQSLLATACSEQSLLATASSEKSLLPTASSEQSLLLLPTVTAVCVHTRACICAEVYMYHSTGKLSTCMPFYNAFTQN